MKLGRPWWTMSPVGVADYGEADSTDNAGGAVLDDEVLTLDYAPAPTPRGDMEAIGAVMSDIRKRVESGVVWFSPLPLQPWLPAWCAASRRLESRSSPLASTSQDPAG